jgi:FkbM family methyltransferase
MKLPALHRILGRDKPTIFDVGARWNVNPRWRRFSEEVQLVGFEPDTEECSRLNSTRTEFSIRYYPVALGQAVGSAVLYKTADPGSSSLLRPNESLVSKFEYGQYLKVVGTLDVQLTTLDAFCRGEGVHPDCLKIDTQGTELAILAGGAQTLDRTGVVELEVEFAPLYVDQPLFADIDAFMRARGFVLLGIRRTYWRRLAGANSPNPLGGQLMHGDALYYREDAVRDSRLTLARVLAMLVVLSAYKQFDLVSDVLRTHPAIHSVSHTEIEALAGELIPKPSFWGSLAGSLSGRINYFKIREFATLFRSTPAYDWHDPEYF